MVVLVIVVLAVGMAIIGGSSPNGTGAWVTFAGTVLLGLLARLPDGAIIGSVLDGPRATFSLTMPMMGLVAISGIFNPITALLAGYREWGRRFPISLGRSRDAFGVAADNAVAIEIGQSRRHIETAAGAGASGRWWPADRTGDVAAHGSSRIRIDHGRATSQGDAACLLRPSTTGSRCGIPNGA